MVAKITLVAIEPLLECPESLAIVVLLVHGSCDFCFVDHRFVQAASCHWADCYATTTVTTLPDIVHHLTREDLLVVGLDNCTHVGGGFVGDLKFLDVEDGVQWR